MWREQDGPEVIRLAKGVEPTKGAFEMEEHNQGKKMATIDLGKGSLGRNKSGSISDNIDQSDESWDHEDYVRYVVKWKGIQESEVIWEYWKDIKQYYVDAAEDFCQRYRPPTAEEVKSISERPHSYVRDFKKINVYP